jgi:hypothetical protein
LWRKEETNRAPVSRRREARAAGVVAWPTAGRQPQAVGEATSKMIFEPCELGDEKTSHAVILIPQPREKDLCTCLRRQV